MATLRGKEAGEYLALAALLGKLTGAKRVKQQLFRQFSYECLKYLTCNVQNIYYENDEFFGLRSNF